MFADLDVRVTGLDTKLSALARLPEDVLLRRPPGGGWSIGEVLEHVLVVDTDMISALRDALDRAGNAAGTPRAWKPTLIARVLLWALRPGTSLRVKAIPKYSNLVPRAGVVAACAAHLGDVRALLERADRVDPNALRITSPINAMVKYSLGDALQILVTHAERHMVQIDRTRAALGL